MRFLECLSDAILNCSPEELIGAMFLVVGIAVVVAGTYALGRRKSSPSPAFVGGLGLAAGLLCMATAAGYLEYKDTDGIPRAGAHAPRFAPWPAGTPRPDAARFQWNPSGFGWSSGFHVVLAADENRDGRITTEEVTQLVRKADTDGDGSVNYQDIDRLIVSRFRSGFHPFGPTAAGVPDGRRTGGGPADDPNRTGGPSESEKSSRNAGE